MSGACFILGIVPPQLNFMRSRLTHQNITSAKSWKYDRSVATILACCVNASQPKFATARQMAQIRILSSIPAPFNPFLMRSIAERVSSVAVMLDRSQPAQFSVSASTRQPRKLVEAKWLRGMSHFLVVVFAAHELAFESVRAPGRLIDVVDRVNHLAAKLSQRLATKA